MGPDIAGRFKPEPPNAGKVLEVREILHRAGPSSTATDPVPFPTGFGKSLWKAV